MKCLFCGNLLLKKWQRKFCSRSCNKFPKTESTKKKISIAGIGRVQSEETKIRRANSNRGKKRSKETKEKMSLAQKGRKHSLETRQKMSEKRKNNPFIRGTYHYNWKPDRSEQRARESVAKICHYLIGSCLRRSSIDKDQFIQELGYSPNDLKLHLESKFKEGMTWENHGQFGWHVDHIKAVINFPLETPMSEINALQNLQPLWWKDNLKKGRKIEISVTD